MTEESFTTTPYGIHDLGGADLLPPNSWITESIEVGADPNDHSGSDFSAYASKGIRVIARVNFNHHGNGTIPTEDLYEDFAIRVANWVRASRGFFILVLGNEPNYSEEWPTDKPITPQQYVACYEAVWRKVQAVQRTPMAAAAIAPWNMNAGHWLDYFTFIVHRLVGKIDYLILHAYTHGVDPDLIFSTDKMDAPNDHLYYHFLAFEDFLDRVEDVRLPVLITESDQNVDWADTNSGWVRNAYSYIDWHNKQPKAHIVIALCLYRWAGDHWQFATKNGVHEDLRDAIHMGYSYNSHPDDSDDFITRIPIVTGGTPTAPTVIDPRLLARGVHFDFITPPAGTSYWHVVRAKWYDEAEADTVGPDHHIVGEVKANGVRVVDLPLYVEWSTDHTTIHSKVNPQDRYNYDYAMGKSLNDYSIRVDDGNPSDKVSGIGMGANGNSGIHTTTWIDWEYIVAKPTTTTPPPIDKPLEFNEGDKVQMDYLVNARKSPGYSDKDASDVLYVLPVGSIVLLLEGPSYADNLTWWYAIGRNNEALGWIAETNVNGDDLFHIDTTGHELYSPFPIPVENPSPSQSALPAYLISAFSRVLGIESRLAKAFIAVESGGVPFAPDGRPLIRFEAHVFRGQLKDDQMWNKFFKVNPDDNTKDQYWRFVDGGVWQPIHTGSQTSEQAAFEFAQKMNRNAAFRSISMGAGQIMGFNAPLLSYPNAEAMYNDFGNKQWGYYNQLIGFFAYIQNRQGMLQATKDKDFRAMSLFYNGSPSYEPLLRDAYANATD